MNHMFYFYFPSNGPYKHAFATHLLTLVVLRWALPAIYLDGCISWWVGYHLWWWSLLMWTHNPGEIRVSKRGHIFIFNQIKRGHIHIDISGKTIRLD